MREQIFDEISYSKGANILRMIEEHMGAEDFRKGIRNYIASYKFSNATGLDLWSLLEGASGKQTKKIMQEWIRKSGYPLITVRKDRNRLVLKQGRFLLSGKSEKQIWPIPVTMKINGKTKHLLMKKEEEIIKIEDLKSLRVNVDRTGFYRVFYNGLYDLVWKANLSPSDKWAIISDALAFLMATRISLEEYLNLLERYFLEQDVLPLNEISSQMSLLHSIIPSRIAETSKKFHSLHLKALAIKTDEYSAMMRGTMAERLAAVDDSYAIELGSRFHEYEKLESDMREAVAVAYARTHGTIEEVLLKYRKSSSDEDKVRLLRSMVSFKDPSLVALSFSLALSGEVKRQDVGTMVLAAARNPDARVVTWKWLKTNISRLKSLYEGTGKLSRILLSVIPVLGIGRVEEVEKFFKENMIPEAETGIKAGLEKLKIYDRLEKFTSN
jgi:tricorn protease interacting factor F2/3